MRFVREVKALQDFRLQLRFDDGVEGVVEFDPFKRGPAFEPLRKVEEFETVFADEFGAVCWSCGLDFDPDSLYERVLAVKQAV